MYQKFFKVLLITLLVILLTSCGPGTSRSTRSHVSGTSTTASSPQASPIAFDIAGLHVQSDYGIECYNHEANWFPTERANLVLADNHPLQYDAPELQQMSKFATAYYNGTLYHPGEPYPSLPSTLRYSWGGTKLFLSNLGWIGCFEEIALTNISKDTFEIQSMNVRLTAAPQPNNEQYRLIDICSLLPSPPMQQAGCPLMKGGGALSYYYFQLNPANVNHIFSPQSREDPPNNLSSVLSPNDTEVIDLVFDSSTSSFIYPIMPELTIGTSNGLQHIALPQLAGNLSFADRSQFSCYTLQGNTFVKEANRPSSLPWVVGNKGLCV